MLEAFFKSNALIQKTRNPMLLIPDIADKHTDFKKKQITTKQNSHKIAMTPEKKKRAIGVLYCSALNTGKLSTYNPKKLAEHGIIYDETAGRFVVV